MFSLYWVSARISLAQLNDFVFLRSTWYNWLSICYMIWSCLFFWIWLNISLFIYFLSYSKFNYFIKSKCDFLSILTSYWSYSHSSSWTFDSLSSWLSYLTFCLRNLSDLILVLNIQFNRELIVLSICWFNSLSGASSDILCKSTSK